ncbi:MAG TPA: hypothetical protein VFB44_18725 [Thermoleophilaceae bacterium]|nr:hypothetical protein [Thermoleophilaceae bacterium]
MTEEPASKSAAATAAEKVRDIVEAAERSATELEAAARAEADRIRGEAQRQTETQLERIQEATDRLSARAAEIEGALDDLGERVRGTIASLREDLRELRGSGSESVAAEPEPPPVGEPIPAVEPAPAAETAPAGTVEAGEGARVIALNMALNGSTREETGRYLAENFELDDPEALLDEVYARAGA